MIKKIENLKSLIEEDSLKEALEVLKDFTKFDNNLNNEVTAKLRDVTSLNSSIRKGIISRNEASLDLRKLTYTTLELIDILKKKLYKNIGFVENEKLISGDEENFLDIAFLEKALKAQKSVCKIETIEGSGTGFLISKDGIILTNNHVIDDKKLLPKTKLIFNYQKDIFGENKQTFEYDLDATYFKTNEKLDYTLVKIKEFQDRFKWGHLNLTKNINVNDRIYIIQHPKGEDKKIAMVNNRVTEIKEPYIRYRVDTLEGSSGSPILNENFEVVGLHHAGLNEKEANQGILISSIFRKK